MMLSSARVPSLAVYPDGDKLGVYLDDGDVAAEVMRRRRDGSVDSYDGED